MFTALLFLIGGNLAITPSKVSQTMARIPMMPARFEILDFGIKFECSVIVSTSCSSSNIFEGSFRVDSDILVKVPPGSSEKTKDGLAVAGWITVGEYASFPAVLSQTGCPDNVPTLCVGPGSEFVDEHSQFRLNHRGLIPGNALIQKSERIMYTSARWSTNGWSIDVEAIHFGNKKISSPIVVAINTDQIAPLAISDRTFSALFGDDVFPSPSADDARLKYYKQSSLGEKIFRIVVNSNMAMGITNLITDGLWFEIITDPTDPRYHQIGLGYNLIESLDIHFDQTRMRIGFKVSV